MNLKENTHTVKILLVEDNPADVRLVQEAFKEMEMDVNLFVAEDGVKALSFLYQEESIQNPFRPDIIFLDLNLPGKDGHEVLQEIKADHDLKVIPVCMLSTSKAKEDIMKTYAYHGNCFITKPVELDEFIAVLESVKDFWFKTVKLPDNE